MNARSNKPAHAAASSANPTPRPEVRAKVRDLLGQSLAFRQLTPAQQQQVARDTALVADALVGKNAADMASVGARALADDTDFREAQAAVDAIGQEDFRAEAAREGAAVAGEFLKQVNFVDFVSGLIDGVFHSVVTSSIEQMEAYSKMVADVAKSVNQFRDENTTEDDGRDQLVEQFPDVFDIGVDEFSGSREPTLRLHDNIDQDSALERVRQALGSYAEGGIDSIDVTDPEAQAKLIAASRSHIATARQQLLATMVLMGLNRIVVTNGKIAAKIVYDFNAMSQRQRSRSAQARGYQYDEPSTQYGASYYTMGLNRFARKPVLTAMSVAADAQTDQLTARANLTGQVEVNFKSDYLPLEKMASPEMMAAIQMRSKPVDYNKPVFKPTEAQPTQETQPAHRGA